MALACAALPAGQARSQPAGAIASANAAPDAAHPARVRTHLERHKRAPTANRYDGKVRETVVTFAIDGRGRLTSIATTQSSGNADYDRDIEAMVRRASPFPRPPNGETLTFSVPVAFTDYRYQTAAAAHLAGRLRTLSNMPTGPGRRSMLITFKLDRQGRVVDAKIDQSSGRQELDALMEAAVRRASPFPPPPPDHVDATYSQRISFNNGRFFGLR